MYFPSISTTKEYKIVAIYYFCCNFKMDNYNYMLFLYFWTWLFYLVVKGDRLLTEITVFITSIKSYYNNNVIPYIMYHLQNYPRIDYIFPGVGFGKRLTSNDWFQYLFYEMSDVQIVSV